MTPDNEKLTAYILGEMDEKERAAFEASLQGDAEAVKLGKELAATAQLAREALKAEHVPSLTADQRGNIRRAVMERGEREVPRRSRRVLWLTLAAAAAVLVIGVSVVLSVPRVHDRFPIAMTPQQESDQASPLETLTEPRSAEVAPSFYEEPPVLEDLNNPVFRGRPGAVPADTVDRAAIQPRTTEARTLAEGMDGVAEKPRETAPFGRGYSQARRGRVANEWSEFSDGEPPAPGIGSEEGRVTPRFGYGGGGLGGNLGGGPGSDLGGSPEMNLSGGLGGGGLGGEHLGRPGAPGLPVQLTPEPMPMPMPAPPADKPADIPGLRQLVPGHNTEAYAPIVENEFQPVLQQPLSTFSIDVDTASYANMRRFLNDGIRPPADAIRIEELVNYFPYDYEAAEDMDAPFAANIEVAECPWNSEHRLARIGLKGWELANDQRPPSNLVFLIDVSGSMQPANKLPLLKDALRMLVRQLGPKDRIAIVTYAGHSGLALPSTPGDEKDHILDLLGRLESGGSTHGSAGIQQAYDVAKEHFIDGGVNRVILCTDGDFNVGVTDQGSLLRLIEEKARTGVFLTVLGFGMGNLKDQTLEMLADKGNGNYGYIDTLNEARKMLVEGLSGTLVTIAKDVKIQVEFNPARVQAYRLIGYENRILAAQDFNDDTKDAGEIGAGHTVTALYELVPPGTAFEGPSVDPLKYQQTSPVAAAPGLNESFRYAGAGELTEAAKSGELFTLKLRYKAPDGDTSKLLSFPVKDSGKSVAEASRDFKFASAVAGFGMMLRGSRYKGDITYDKVMALAEEGIGPDLYGYRSEFLSLVNKARGLDF